MYQSPIRLTGFDALRHGQRTLRSALLVARRKMEAEFELADRSTIRFEGQELNRQEVVTLFDELKDEQRLAWHLAIYEDKTLLLFLEQGILQPDGRWAHNPVYGESRFLHFVSPYFAAAIDTFYRRLLTGGASLGSLQALAGNTSYMLSSDAERAFRYVTRYFLEKKNELMRLQLRASASEAILRQEVKEAVPDDSLTVLNYLPDTYNDLRYGIANALNNLCVAFDQKSYKRHALVAIEKAAKVSVTDDELQTLIPRNLNIIRSKQTGSFFKVDEQGKKQPKWGLIIAIVVLLIRISGCLMDGSSTSSTTPIDIRNMPTAADFEFRLKPQPLNTFHSLVFSLIGGSPDSFRSRMVERSYVVQEPRHTGELVFPILLADEFASDAGLADSSVAGKQKTLLVRNNSSWNLLLCFTLDDRSCFIRYVAPKDEYTLYYTAKIFGASVMAGKDWDPSRRFIFNSYAAGALGEIRGITGGYRQVPENMHELIDVAGTPVYTNSDTTGNALFETLEVSDGVGHTISVLKKPGSAAAMLQQSPAAN